jgi:hypothetical protein
MSCPHYGELSGKSSSAVGCGLDRRCGRNDDEWQVHRKDEFDIVERTLPGLW